jgi:F0F1-type ATP synthase assembly protein I
MPDPKNKSQTDSPRPTPPKGWVGDLAQRSSGLPNDTTKADPKTGSDQQDSNPWKFAGVGIQFAGTIGLFALFGYGIDRHFGWSPWGTVTLVMIAIVGNTYLLIKEALKINR